MNGPRKGEIWAIFVYSDGRRLVLAAPDPPPEMLQRSEAWGLAWEGPPPRTIQWRLLPKPELLHPAHREGTGNPRFPTYKEEGWIGKISATPSGGTANE